MIFSKKLYFKVLIAFGATGLLPAFVLAQTCADTAANLFATDTLIDASADATLDQGESIGSAGVIQMGIAVDGRVFIGKMQTGQIRAYKPGQAKNTSYLIGTIPTYFNTEDGLLGMTLDPNFASNHWLYAFYSDPCGENCTNRAMELGRYTVDTTQGTTGLGQLTHKKVILRFPREKTDTHHAAGGIMFDGNGVLVIGVGDNTDPHDATNAGYGPIYTARVPADAQRTASNTNDLRGKTLRIQPMTSLADNSDTTVAGGSATSGIGLTYTIPTGNLWEKINDPTFNPAWDNATDSISKVRHEIYTFGSRNPYHPRVDTRSGWVFWGEVGPDANSDGTRGPSGHDEWNLATSGPGFYGHPYCNGYNVPYAAVATIVNSSDAANSATYGNKYDCLETGSSSLAPLVNNSPNNTGIHHMPKAIPALAAYTSGNSTDDDPRFNSTYSLTSINHAAETAIGAPMYRYDSTLSSGRFPPYFEGKVPFFDWSRRSFRIINLTTSGTIPAGAAGVSNFAPRGFPTASYIDAEWGPRDGMLYMLRFSDNGYTGGAGGGLYRIRYIGAYDNTCYTQFVVSNPGPGATQGTTAIHRDIIHRDIAPLILSDGFLRLPPGYKTVELYDLSGRQVWSFHREQTDAAYQVRVPAGLSHGVLQAKLLP